MGFGAGFLLLVWVVVSIFSNGIACLHRFTKLRGLELLGYGAAAGVLLHALLGCLIAAIPGFRWLFVMGLIALTILALLYFLRRKLLGDFHSSLSKATKISLALWALLLVFGLGVLHVKVRFPEVLPDGLYIFKTHTTNVKIQYLTGLPVDNYIPFAVAEFFLRGVSFKRERPILPGNEVTNRTIMMSLVSLPFRVALGAPHDHPRLGKYSYIGREWPDISKLNTDYYFEQFAIIGLFLNSLLLVGLLVFCSGLGANVSLPYAALLYVTNPYFLTQTIYTWPKALAGFFILLAWTSIRRGGSPILVGALMALAYHSHPYAIVFAACGGLYYLARWRPEWRRAIASACVYGLSFGLLLVPWIVWTKFILQIPSDLVSQNFAGSGTEAAWASPVNFVWIRLYNLFCLVSPMMMAVYPFDLQAVYNNWTVCIPGVVGPVLVYPAVAQCTEDLRGTSWLWYGFVAPALLILAVFSCVALPVLHGYQSLLGLLLCLGVWWLWQHSSRRLFFVLVALQLVINLSLIVVRAVITGVQF